MWDSRLIVNHVGRLLLILDKLRVARADSHSLARMRIYHRPR